VERREGLGGLGRGAVDLLSSSKGEGLQSPRPTLKNRLPTVGETDNS